VTTTRETVAKANGDPKRIMTQLGVPNLNSWDTYNTEFLPQLRGSRAVKYWREMSDNDATIGEILFAIEMLIRQVKWPVQAGGETPQDLEAAAFLESCRDDMSSTWEDFIATVLTFLPYGWCFQEVVYKLRTPSESRFSDGLVGWKKFAYQPQEAWESWVLDEFGGVQGFRWATGGRKGEIPIEKGLLFRTTTARGPNGRSILRNAFRAWQMKKRLEEIAVIGVDRDLNGLPIARIPADMILDNDSFFEEAKKVVTRIKKDEQWGVVWPLEYTEQGNPLYEFDVMSSNGSASIAATQDLISMYASDIAGTVLADFIRLGRDTVGSRALAEPKQQLFQKALQGWVDGIAEVINRHAVPRLFALNGFSLEVLPRFNPEQVEDTQLLDLATFIQGTANSGMDWGFLNDEDPITDQIRQLAGFDAAPETPGGVGKGLEFDSTRRVYKMKE
jgi:hypothetical protein